MNRATRALQSPILLAACALLAVACGSGVDGAGGGDGGGPSGDGPPDGISAALAVVPAHEGAAAFVVVNDLAKAAEAAGLTVPADGTDNQALGTYFTELSGIGDAPVAAAPAELVRTSALQDAEWRAEVGFAPVDLTGDVSSGQPPDQLQTFFGDFDLDTVTAAVESDPTWSADLETVEHEGNTYFSWGEDHAVAVTNASAVRRLGESARLFVDDEAGVAYWARSTALMEEAMDTFAGEAPSLADDPEIGPLAEALDGLDAYSAALIGDAEQFAGAPGGELAPYDAVATGASLVDGQARLLLVLLHADEATAADNAERLAEVVADGESAVNGRPWSDVLGEGEIEVDGSLVVASFPTDDARLWNGIVVTRDTLLATAG